MLELFGFKSHVQTLNVKRIHNVMPLNDNNIGKGIRGNPTPCLELPGRNQDCSVLLTYILPRLR